MWYKNESINVGPHSSIPQLATSVVEGHDAQE
jgi:hypothetical protein